MRARRREGPPAAAPVILAIAACLVTVGAAAAARAQQHQRLDQLADGSVGDPAAVLAPVKISADGRYAVFTSSATNLVPGFGDTNGARDVFRVDLATKEIVRVSVGPNLEEGDGDSGVGSFRDQIGSDIDISGDGSRIVFVSRASNWDPDSRENAVGDVFLRDETAGTTVLVSKFDSADGFVFARGGAGVAISDDGASVAFASSGEFGGVESNPGDADVWLYDVAARTFRLASALADGSEAAFGDSSGRIALSGDGTELAFFSRSPDLTGVGPGESALVVKDLVIGDVAAFPARRFPSFSTDGSVWSFSTGEALAASDVNTAADIYIEDRLTGELRHASVGPGGEQSAGNCEISSLSGDGAVVALSAKATSSATTATTSATPTSSTARPTAAPAPSRS